MCLNYNYLSSTHNAIHRAHLIHITAPLFKPQRFVNLILNTFIITRVSSCNFIIPSLFFSSFHHQVCENVFNQIYSFQLKTKTNKIDSFPVNKNGFWYNWKFQVIEINLWWKWFNWINQLLRLFVNWIFIVSSECEMRWMMQSR